MSFWTKINEVPAGCSVQCLSFSCSFRQKSYLSALKHLCVGSPFTTPLCPGFSFNLSALKHLCIGPLYHTNICWVHFQHSSMMMFLHLNIYMWAPSTTPLY